MKFRGEIPAEFRSPPFMTCEIKAARGNPTPFIPHPTPCTLHPTPYTLNRELYTLTWWHSPCCHPEKSRSSALTFHPSPGAGERGGDRLTPTPCKNKRIINTALSNIVEATPNKKKGANVVPPAAEAAPAGAAESAIADSSLSDTEAGEESADAPLPGGGGQAAESGGEAVTAPRERRKRGLSGVEGAEIDDGPDRGGRRLPTPPGAAAEVGPETGGKERRTSDLQSEHGVAFLMQGLSNLNGGWLRGDTRSDDGPARSTSSSEGRAASAQGQGSSAQGGSVQGGNAQGASADKRVSVLEGAMAVLGAGMEADAAGHDSEESAPHRSWLVEQGPAPGARVPDSDREGGGAQPAVVGVLREHSQEDVLGVLRERDLDSDEGEGGGKRGKHQRFSVAEKDEGLPVLALPSAPPLAKPRQASPVLSPEARTPPPAP
ncbi:hypothetical protein T484DRAFT_2197817 [Baffinella frigidus]|nr:hypothetical protein T484DRAFT_2197817 [Cryptophyta sp. CCMP2293]